MPIYVGWLDETKKIVWVDYEGEFTLEDQQQSWDTLDRLRETVSYSIGLIEDIRHGNMKTEQPDGRTIHLIGGRPRPPTKLEGHIAITVMIPHETFNIQKAKAHLEEVQQPLLKTVIGIANVTYAPNLEEAKQIILRHLIKLERRIQ